MAKKHSAPKLDVTLNFKTCYQEFPGFHAVCQHKNTQHGFPIKTAKFELYSLLKQVDDATLKEDLRSCQLFLVASEPGRAETQSLHLRIGISQQDSSRREI